MATSTRDQAVDIVIFGLFLDIPFLNHCSDVISAMFMHAVDDDQTTAGKGTPDLRKVGPDDFFPGLWILLQEASLIRKCAPGLISFSSSWRFC